VRFASGPPLPPIMPNSLGDLVHQTRPLGLSFRERACLALGLALKAPIYTADKSWKKLKLGFDIYVIR
jgi:ribonuclease VapC